MIKMALSSCSAIRSTTTQHDHAPAGTAAGTAHNTGPLS